MDRQGFTRQIVQAVSQATGEVMDERLAERDARLDYLERALSIDERYRAIVESPLWVYAIRAMATGDEDKWSMAEEIGCTVPELEWAAERWKRSWRR